MTRGRAAAGRSASPRGGARGPVLAVAGLVALIVAAPPGAASGASGTQARGDGRPAAIRVVTADWGALGGWGGERGRCDVAGAVDALCAGRRRCVVPVVPELCRAPTRPMPGLGRTLSVTYRCGERGATRVVEADLPGTVLLRCAR